MTEARDGTQVREQMSRATPLLPHPTPCTSPLCLTPLPHSFRRQVEVYQTRLQREAGIAAAEARLELALTALGKAESAQPRQGGYYFAAAPIPGRADGFGSAASSRGGSPTRSAEGSIAGGSPGIASQPGYHIGSLANFRPSTTREEGAVHELPFTPRRHSPGPPRTETVADFLIDRARKSLPPPTTTGAGVATPSPTGPANRSRRAGSATRKPQSASRQIKSDRTASGRPKQRTANSKSWEERSDE